MNRKNNIQSNIHNVANILQDSADVVSVNFSQNNMSPTSIPKTGQIFKRGMSIRHKDPEITRKCNIELIEKKIIEFEDLVDQIETHIRTI